MSSRRALPLGPLALGVLVCLVPSLALGAGGGPDPFGYTWVDNNPVVGGCAYNFVDISATGASAGTGDDTVFIGIPIGFTFTYYGTAFTTVNAATNGYLAFNTTGSSFSNTCPQPVTLNDLQISPFWDDLYIFPPSSLLFQTIGTAPNRTFIMQWNNVGFCCTSPPGGAGLTLQVQFRETSNIIAFMYSDVQQTTRTRGDSATIGIDGPGTTNFLGTSCNVASLTNGHARFFLPPGVTACQQTCTLTPPANISIGTNSGCAAVVNYTVGATTGCGTVTCNPASGSTFQLGTTTVNCSSQNGGQTTSFTVTVFDDDPPVLTCPANVQLYATNTEGGQTGFYPPPAVAENCPGVGAVSCAPPAGTFFPFGTNPVTCSATDAAGLTGTCGFNVIVTPRSVLEIPTLAPVGLAGLAILLAGGAVVLLRRRRA